MNKVITWIKAILLLNLFTFICYLYLINLNQHFFHLDEYWFTKRAYFYDLFIKRDWQNPRWQEDNFEQPRLGPLIYGLTLHFHGIKDIEKYQEKIGFHQIKIDNQPWWEVFFLEQLDKLPKTLVRAGEVILWSRQTAVLFTLGCLVIVFGLGIITGGVWYGLIFTLLLAINPLMLMYGRLAMTDSFQLFFFYQNLLMLYFYQKSLADKKSRLVLWLSLGLGVNVALAASVKVIGLLALLYSLMFIGLLLWCYLKQKKTNLKSLLLSFPIIIFSFILVFILLNPQVHSEPIRGIYRLFLIRWDVAEHCQQYDIGPVDNKLDAFRLISQRLLLPGNDLGNFSFVPFIPLDLIFLMAGCYLLSRKGWQRWQKHREISIELILLSWFGLTFISLVFYLKNNWSRYYLPLASAITIIQSYFICWLMLKGSQLIHTKYILINKAK